MAEHPNADDYRNRAESAEAEAAELRERGDKLAEALTFIADLPDPGEEKERSAVFYRIHAACLKQVAAEAIGRPTVSQEALDWAEEWVKSDQGRTALNQWNRS